jgi:hypothetical protein
VNGWSAWPDPGGGVWNQKAQPGGYLFFEDRDSSLFDPEEMAASAQY